MAYTYPFVIGAGKDITAADVHAFLKSPTQVARRVADLAAQRFVADFLLKGRYSAEGGAVTWSVDDSLYSDDDPETIAPGAEYPLTTAGEGAPETARTEKDGQDTEITDEAIKRMLLDPVNRALLKMVNRTVRRVDAKALGIIGSEVTATHAAGAAWTDGEAIVVDVLTADAKMDALDLGLAADAVLLKPLQFAKVAGFFMKADMLAGGITGAVASGVIPNVMGKTWVTSNNVPFNDPLLVDSEQLGGIATENLGSPGYTAVPGTVGLETKVMRIDDRDAYRPRVRRVGVAAVIEPRAGIRITGTGL